MTDLERLLNNFDSDQMEILSVIASRMAALKSERWTGRINFELNSNQGGLCDVHVNRVEVVRLKKQRSVRK